MIQMKPKLLRLASLLFLLISFGSRAQIIEDFSDGDFTANPAWIGMTDSFTVSTGQLRTTAGNASSVNLYLATASTENFTNWEFSFRLNFNPSSQNYAEFWLTCDNLDFTQAQNGYFIRMGGAADGIGLFKKQAGTTTEIIPQNNTLVSNASNNQGSIKVVRNGGNWELFEKITTTGFISFGTGTDNSLTTSSGIGVLIKSSKTNRTKHYFDDIRAENLSGPDLTPPSLVNASYSGNNIVDLQFSEAVDPVFCATTSLYSLNPAVGITSATRLASNPSQVRLVLASSLSFGTNTITVNQSKDVVGNLQTTAQQTTVFYDPVASYNSRDVVINEIYADESPSLGLPSGEFVELRNNTQFQINLQGFKFSDAATEVSLPRYILPSNGYVILCKSVDTTAFKAFGPTVSISLPSLNNSGDLLTLKDPADNVIDQVNYALSWYKDGTKDDGGFTLEQINPSLKCSGITNWIASNAAIGGTPGTQNSVFSNVGDTSAPALDSVVVDIGLVKLKLVFNESLGSDPVPASSFSIPGLTISGVTVLDDHSLLLVLSGPIVTGQNYSLTYSGIKDCEGNTSAQPISFPFIYLPPAPIASRALVINEIYADETPSLGLPRTEYLELFNTLDIPVQLKGVNLFVGSTLVKLPEYVFPPKSYLILCETDSVPSFQNLGPALGINLPLLNNTGTEIRLEDKDNSVVDKVSYLVSWYKNPSKQNGGYSLEQVNPFLVCSSKDNWIASIAGIGGTPGVQNSVYSDAPDNSPPSMVSFEILDSNTVQLNFSEPMNALFPDPASFVIPGLTIASIQNRFPSTESITLNFTGRMILGTKYTLTLKNMKDCGLNTMADSSFGIGIGKQPERFDLLFTEVQADDTPENDLPASEYIEILNNTNQLLDLAGVQITDGGTPARIPSRLLGPGEYLLLVGTGDAVRFNSLKGIQIQEVTSLPSINSEGDDLTLLNANGGWIHRFFFESAKYSPYSLWTKGWSLEMIDTGNPCDELNNWAISTAAAGGTPGLVNSVKASKPDVVAPHFVRLSVPDSVTFRLQWDELVDSVTLSEAEISISGNYQVQKRIQRNTDLSSLYIEVNREIQRNEQITITVGLVKDCAGNATQVESKTTARPFPADSSSWILNEILFDPKTGGSDYVEIRNVSPYYLDLKELQLANDNDNVAISNESYPVEPGGYILLTESKTLTMRDYPKGKVENFLEISLPSFNSDSGTVRLIGPRNNVWQKFFYSDKFHAQILDETKGVSLEKITPTMPVNSPASWQSASSDAGYGTPGYQNSQSRDFDPQDSFIADPKAFSPNGDGNKDFTLFSYETTKSGRFGNLRIYSAEGLLIKNLAESAHLGTQSFWKWDGVTEEGRKARVGLYMAVLELIELGGNTEYVKIPVAIAADR